jgi:uncharacterized membrane protein YbaN (DUF454 family)
MEEIRTTKKTLRWIALVVLGWSLVVTGVIGLALPVVPGGLLMALGLLVLSTEHPWLRPALEKLRARFPFVRRAFESAFLLRRKPTKGCFL